MFFQLVGKLTTQKSGCKNILWFGKKYQIPWLKNEKPFLKKNNTVQQRRSSTLWTSLRCRRARRLGRSHRWSLPPLQTPAVGGSDGCRGVGHQHKAGSESGGTSRRTLAEPDVPSAGVKVTLLSEGRNNVAENTFPAFGLDVLLQL